MRMNYSPELSLQKRQQSHYDFNGAATRRMREQRKTTANWMVGRQFLLPHMLRYFWWKIFWRVICLFVATPLRGVYSAEMINSP